MPDNFVSGSVEFTTASPDETQRLGEALGALLRPGDVVALDGQLGAGKTTLIQGLARGVGVDERQVKSPTFILMREYPGGRVPIIHVDAYRLEDSASAVWLDEEWLFSRKKITVIEWSARVADCLPEDRLRIELTHRGETERALRLAASGARSHQILGELQARLARSS